MSLFELSKKTYFLLAISFNFFQDLNFITSHSYGNKNSTKILSEKSDFLLFSITVLKKISDFVAWKHNIIVHNSNLKIDIN